MSLVKDINWTPTIPQAKAWEYWWDDQTVEILFGGGAGGGKSFMGCLLILLSACKYDGTRWLMGRSELTAFKSTTLKTFWEVVDFLGLEVGKDIVHNQGNKEIVLSNGSEIIYRDLKYYPSKDPDFDSLGSLEITGAFIDEANQVTTRCKNIVGSRCRYKLDEHNLKSKIIFTCNPAKNWTYREFYKPWRDKSLSNQRAFVQALASDNINVSRQYIEQLSRLPESSKQRLLFGNWEFDDDPNTMFERDKLLNMFTKDFSPKGDGYISVDVARLGSDSTVVYLWDGLTVTSIKKYTKKRTTETARLIEEIANVHGIPMDRVIVDEDGVGGGVVDMLGCIGFVNNSRPRVVSYYRNYSNLKTQCFFELKRLVDNGKIKIAVDTFEEEIVEELSLIKERDVDKDTKIRITKKEDIKEQLGRSPDFADAIMMRCWFELDNEKETKPYDYSQEFVDKKSSTIQEKLDNTYGLEAEDDIEQLLATIE